VALHRLSTNFYGNVRCCEVYKYVRCFELFVRFRECSVRFCECSVRL
jgi:hypothetical protein